MTRSSPSNATILQDAAFNTSLEKLRDRSLSPREVRAVTSQLTAILARKAIVAPAPGEKIAIVLILRSGLAMFDAFASELPEDADTVVYHLGLFREKQTLQPVEYYNKLPPKDSRIHHAYVLDPLLATGGTAGSAINILKDWGVEKITFVSILASAPGLSIAAKSYPESCHFLVGAVDEDLDAHGYVQPGVGDIGDRLYGTNLL